MSSISSLVLSQACSAVDEAIHIAQEQIKTQSEKLSKQVEALLRERCPLRAPPASQSVVGGLNQTTDICPTVGLTVGEEYPGTMLRRSERLAAKAGARWGDVGAPADGAEPPDYILDLHTRESFTAPILDLTPRPRAYSERKSMGVTKQPWLSSTTSNACRPSLILTPPSHEIGRLFCCVLLITIRSKTYLL